jgi:hypothetical protein
VFASQTRSHDLFITGDAGTALSTISPKSGKFAGQQTALASRNMDVASLTAIAAPSFEIG